MLLLQVHRRLTCGDLARRLEVSRRTVLRDMYALSAAGVPVMAERGRSGGWSLDRAWRTNLTGLDTHELSALFVAQPPGVMTDLGLSRAADRATVKLLASLPAAQRQRAAMVRERLHVDSQGWWGQSDDPAWLPTVQEAVWQERRLALRYRAAALGESVERTVEPLGLVARGSAWYLIARTAGHVRTYRVARIEQARLLDEVFARPEGFDLAAYWRASSAEFRRRRPQYPAILRMAESAACWVRGWSVWMVERSEPADEAGLVTLHMRFDREEEACFLALGLGSLVEVLSPGALRERVGAEAQRVAERCAARG